VIYNNRNWGIFYETFYGGTKIHQNTLTNNAAGWIMAVQLLVASSDGSVGGSGGIEIYKNTIDGAAYPSGSSLRPGARSRSRFTSITTS
jgi:hypothetical protein